MAQQSLSTGTFGSESVIVSSDATKGTHTTIQSAVNYAQGLGVGTVFITPGIYNENITLPPTVALVGDTTSADSQVSIYGSIGLSGTGIFPISNLTFFPDQTIPSYLITGGGAGAQTVAFKNCSFSGYVDIMNLTNSNANSIYNFNYCFFDESVSSASLYESSISGVINFFNCRMTNTAGSVSLSNNSSGTVNLTNCTLAGNFTTTSTGILNVTGCNITTSGGTMFGIAGGSCVIQRSYLNAGTNPIVNCTSPATVSLIDCTYNSSNGSPFAGSGTISYSSIENVNGASASRPSSSTVSALGVTLGNTKVNALTMSTAPPNGSLLIGNATNFTNATLTAGANISVTNGAGAITIAAAATSLSTAPADCQSSSLSIGSAYQNTFGYDVLLNVYLLINSTTNGSLFLGVGSTSTPLQQQIVTNITTATPFIVTVPIYLPKNYYALLTTNGTISVSITGQQALPI